MTKFEANRFLVFGFLLIINNVLLFPVEHTFVRCSKKLKTIQVSLLQASKPAFECNSLTAGSTVGQLNT